MTASTETNAGPRLAVLFVCMGNICRSPTAEGVFRAKLVAAGLAERVHVDSAGTHGYHVGEPPDFRSVSAAARRGYDLSALRARRLEPEDAARFDYVIAMDRGNYNRILREFGQGGPSSAVRARVHMFLEFAPGVLDVEVPDPYGGGPQGFERVLDLIEAGADGLVAEVAARLRGGEVQAPAAPDGH